ncbi:MULTISPECIES: EcsC family protein [Clostridium]|uniref:EcsC family protein n=1 Tax=Clostridium TaxID=1485 RepID=UPI00257C41B8|nr:MULTISPECIES: EcsC family protein [Clostridium]MDU1401189.1 EcsC family protein [Clostridium sp.]MDU1603386.1 EcsC family protein [Clostridium sp.]MDU2894201.1 EcsC family protein [Clostridium sp.]MDU3005979.1 EcsC family protein [Clostridium sp.]MDU3036127.1 EcsC family protein [Clostridium sp.]
MENTIENNKIMEVLDWAYEKTLNGLPGTLSAEELAEEYLAKNDWDNIKACNSLINWQISKSATSGFLTGLGGIITLPVAIPANVSSVIYIQMRMIAAIAYIGGHDIKDDSVKSLVYMCLTGNAAVEIAKDIGIKIGTKLTQSTIQKISYETIKRINQAVGFRLITKFGTKGVVNLGKVIPVVGGIIGGGIDSVSTKTIGKIAEKVFIY